MLKVKSAETIGMFFAIGAYLSFSFTIIGGVIFAFSGIYVLRKQLI